MNNTPAPVQYTYWGKVFYEVYLSIKKAPTVILFQAFVVAFLSFTTWFDIGVELLWGHCASKYPSAHK